MLLFVFTVNLEISFKQQMKENANWVSYPPNSGTELVYIGSVLNHIFIKALDRLIWHRCMCVFAGISYQTSWTGAVILIRCWDTHLQCPSKSVQWQAMCIFKEKLIISSSYSIFLFCFNLRVLVFWHFFLPFYLPKIRYYSKRNCKRTYFF